MGEAHESLSSMSTPPRHSMARSSVRGRRESKRLSVCLRATSPSPSLDYSGNTGDLSLSCVKEARDEQFSRKRESIAALVQRGIHDHSIMLYLARLLKEFSFFVDLDKEIQTHLPDIVTYESELKGTVLFRQGAPPGRCYILLTGIVEVWKDEHDNSICDEPESGDIDPPSPTSVASSGTAAFMRRVRSMKAVPLIEANPNLIRKCKAVADMLHIISTGMSAADALAATSPLSNASGKLTQQSPGRLLPCGTPGSITHPSPASRLSIASPTSSDDNDWDSNLITGHPVCMLGAGTLFGELALLEDQPRNASIRCKENCQFLVIERFDFESVLKASMRRAHVAKLDFLRLHVPGFRDLADKKAEDMSYLFKKATFAKNHTFSTQGGLTNGIINVVVKGAVELTLHSTPNIPVFQGLPEIASRRLGVLVAGGIFGSLHVNRHDPFNAIASTSPCDVYQLSIQDFRRLPEAVLTGIRDVIDRTMQFRLLRCDRPAELAGVMNRPKKPVGFGKNKKAWREKATLAWPDGNDDAGTIEFDLAPGECIAMSGKRPHLRRLAPSPCSKSMPNLRRPNTGEPKPRSTMSSSSSRLPSRPSSTPAGESNYLGL